MLKLVTIDVDYDLHTSLVILLVRVYRKANDNNFCSNNILKNYRVSIHILNFGQLNCRIYKIQIQTLFICLNLVHLSYYGTN